MKAQAIVGSPAEAWTVGIDLGYHSHRICLVDPQGGCVLEQDVLHNGAAIEALIQQLLLRTGSDPAQLEAALECPQGALVEAFLARGLSVWAINPKALDRFRDRFSLAGAKDDRRDAFLLAVCLRSDRYAFRRVEPLPERLLQLKELERRRKTLQEEEVRGTHHLREALHRWFPQLLTLAPAADKPWQWSLLVVAPTLGQARRLSGRRLAAILQDGHARIDPAQLRQALSKPDLPQASGLEEIVALELGQWAAQMQLIHRQGRALEQAIAQLLRAAPRTEEEGRLRRDMVLLHSLPGVGAKVLTSVVTRAALSLRQQDYHSLALLAGVLPVTRQSGGKKVVGMRYACDHALRDALFNGAWVASCRDPHWKARYLELRARGKTHAHALRIIGAQLLRVAIALLKEGVPYDRSRLRRRMDLNESNRWLVAEPAGLTMTPEREPVMVLGG
jgi:transposase